MTQTEQLGVANPHVVDEVAYDPSSEEIVLIMTEKRPWHSLDNPIHLLKEKIAKYIEFAFGDQLASEFPDHKGKSIRFQLESSDTPDQQTLEFLSKANEVLGKKGARLVINVAQTNPTDSDS
jgi:hypothetical protein